MGKRYCAGLRRGSGIGGEFGCGESYLSLPHGKDNERSSAESINPQPPARTSTSGIPGNPRPPDLQLGLLAADNSGLRTMRFLLEK